MDSYLLLMLVFLAGMIVGIYYSNLCYEASLTAIIKWINAVTKASKERENII